MNEQPGEAKRTTPAHGVQELIARIRDEGVRSARAEADRILAEAREEASRMIADAKQEVADMRAQASASIERDRSAAIESLNMAARDTALELRGRIVAGFERSVRRLVTLELKDEGVIRSLILTLAGRVREEIADHEAQILLAEAVLDGSDDGGDSEAGERVREMVHGLTANMLREGVELLPASDVRAGARVRLVGADVELDLTDEALSSLFLEHLLPRFAEMLRGAD